MVLRLRRASWFWPDLFMHGAKTNWNSEDRHERVDVQRLGRDVLPAQNQTGVDVGVLRHTVFHGGDQCHVLPSAHRVGGRKLAQVGPGLPQIRLCGESATGGDAL